MDERNRSAAEAQDRRERRSEAHEAETYGRFLNDVRSLTGLTREEAERTAASVLCALEQRLFPTRALKLESQLPVRLVELVVGCEAHPVPKGEAKIGREEMIALVAEHLGEDRGRTEDLTRQVMLALRAQITDGEAEKVASQLPADLQQMWMNPA
jgi:uncharacterized protein (DUF2267 family)